MIENCIITPTYKGHFPFIKKYLKTYVHFVEDAHEVPVFFIISKNESNEFQKLISPFIKKANLQVLYFEDILSKYGINDDSDTLLKKYGRYSFQTLKKMYAIKFIDANHFLILDSESMWIKPTNMSQVFNRYFSSPFVIYSSNKDRKPSQFMKKMADNVGSVLNQKIDFWAIESNMWFIDKKIYKDMESILGSPLDWTEISLKTGTSKIQEENGLMEALLYQSWLVINAEKYKYKKVNAYDFMQIYCSQNEVDCYTAGIDRCYPAGVGLFEDLLIGAYDEIENNIINIIKNLGLTIVRCDFSDFFNYKRQKRIVYNTDIHILACSQNNIFAYREIAYLKFLLKKLIFGMERFYRKILYKISPLYRLEVHNSERLQRLDEIVSRLISIEASLTCNQDEEA